MRPTPARTPRRPVPALLIGLAALTACAPVESVPPTFSVYSITDKFFDVQALGNDKFVALGYGNKVMASDDGGHKWEILSRPAGRSLTRLEFSDENNAYGVGHGGQVVQTSDGGKTWKQLASATKRALFGVSVASPNKIVTVGDVSTIHTSTDAGATWNEVTLPISTIGVRPDMSLAIEDPIFYDVQFLDEQNGWIVGEYGQIRVTRDGGETWGAQHDDLMGGRIRDVMSLPTLMKIKFRDPMNGQAVGTDGAVIVTSDGGETWDYVKVDIKEPLYDIEMLPNGDSVLTGSSGLILRGNPTAGWSLAEIPIGVYSWVSTAAISPAGKGVAVGGFGLVLTSEDAGRTWVQTLYQ